MKTAISSNMASGRHVGVQHGIGGEAAQMVAAEATSDYRYDEAKMLAGIQSWQRERKLQLRAARAAVPAVVPAAELVDPDLEGRRCRVLPVQRSVVVHFTSLPCDARPVCELVCAEFGITLERLTSQRSTWDICKVRHVAFYLMMRVMGVSSVRTARAMGGFHHATVLNSVRVVDARMQRDAEYCRRVKWMSERLACAIA
jgi:hypothetical protein